MQYDRGHQNILLLLNLQVGLRWWNYIDENGDSQWMFEKRNGDSVHLLSATEVTTSIIFLQVTNINLKILKFQKSYSK